MPTIRCGSPSSVMVRPTSCGSAAKRRFHRASETTATRSRPGCASSARKPRPMATPTPIASKNAGLTLKPCSRSGSVWPAIVASHHSRATRLAARTSRWKSTKSAGDTSRRSAIGPASGATPNTCTRRSMSRSGKGRRTRPSTSASTVALAARPTASVSTTTKAKARWWASRRAARRRSRQRPDMNESPGIGKGDGAGRRARWRATSTPAGDAGRLPPVPRGGAEASAGAPLGVMLLGEIAEDGVRGRRGPDQLPEQPFGQARRAPVSHSLHCRQNTAAPARKFHHDSGVVLRRRLRSRGGRTPESFGEKTPGIVGGRPGRLRNGAGSDSGVVAGGLRSRGWKVSGRGRPRP